MGRWNNRYRFIPTGVGNTCRIASAVSRAPVHPHRRGEHSLATCRMCTRNGSSPQAWGTRIAGTDCGKCERFIPTGAGNTLDGLFRDILKAFRHGFVIHALFHAAPVNSHRRAVFHGKPALPVIFPRHPSALFRYCRYLNSAAKPCLPPVYTRLKTLSAQHVNNLSQGQKKPQHLAESGRVGLMLMDVISRRLPRLFKA